MALLRTPDGRALDVTVTGPEAGVPLVFHHGTPSSVVQFRSMQRATAARSLRRRGPVGWRPARPGRRRPDFLAGMGEQNHLELGAARAGELALRAYLEVDAEGLRDVQPAGIAAATETLLPPVDRAALHGEYGEDLAANLREAVRTGVDGWLDDDLLPGEGHISTASTTFAQMLDERVGTL